ncbi:MAG: T9SS type A sorting domain-containing protein [Bacteroidetes bacterium]|nr:T9SS type A sorting domain-containing protein [Bacteroidota bacterium]
MPNWSFEDTINCSTWSYPTLICYPWFNPTISTPDYFTTYPSCGINVYTNLQGYQLPKSGNAFSGLFCYEQSEQRDYIEISLIDSLKHGHNYACSFWVSLANTSLFAIDKIGMCFSNDTIKDYNSALTLNYIPQIESTSNVILEDTLNWVQIGGNFMATGGEKYLTIGTFRANASLNVQIVNGWFYAAYYYIDDIKVIEDTSTYILETIETKLPFFYKNPIERGTSLVLQHNKPNLEIEAIRIYNSSGYEMQSKISLTKNDMVEINTKDFVTGLYFFLLLEINKKHYTIKFLIV